MGKDALACAVGVELAQPGVFQVQGVDQQRGGVLFKGLVDDGGDQLFGVVGHPAVHRLDDSLIGQVGLEHLGIEDALALAHELVFDLPLRVGPDAVGDVALGGAAQGLILLHQLGAGGIDGLQIAAEQDLKLLQGVPPGPVGAHGQGQGRGQGRDQHLLPLLGAYLPQQLYPKAGQGVIDGCAPLRLIPAGDIDGGGGQLPHLGAALGPGGGAAGQQDHSGQQNGKQTVHNGSSLLLRSRAAGVFVCLC